MVGIVLPKNEYPMKKNIADGSIDKIIAFRDTDNEVNLLKNVEG